MMIWLTLIAILIVSGFVYYGRQKAKTRREFELRNVLYYNPTELFFGFFRGRRIEMVIRKILDKIGNVFGYYAFGSYTIMVAEPELLQLILSKEFTNFTNRRDVTNLGKFFANALSAVQDEQWKRLRSIITPTFASGKIKRMKPCIDEVSKTLVGNFDNEIREKNDAVDIKRYAGAFTMDVITRVAFGIQVDSIADPNNSILLNVRRLFAKDQSLLGILQFIFVVYMPKLAKLLGIGLGALDQAIKFFEELSTKIIEEKRVKFRQQENIGKATNFIELLLEAELEGEMQNNEDESGKVHKYISNVEITSQCVLFFLAGFETTATTITLTCYYLATNPEKQEKLAAEINEIMVKLSIENPDVDPYELVTYETLGRFEYLAAVINETLRISPPAAMTERCTGNDIKLETSDGKIRINLRQNDMIQIPIYSLHHSEEYFSEPDRYEPERFLGEPTFPKYAYLPFGSGPRNCVARSLALLEARIAVLHLIRCYKLSPCAKTKIPLEFYNQDGLIAPKDVLLQVEKR